MNTQVKSLFLFLILAWLCIPLAAAFPGNSLYFEQGDYVSGTGIPTSMSGVTLECWVKHDVFPTSIQRYVTLKNEVAVIRAESDGVLNFYIKQSNGSLYSVSATVLAADEWLHVAGSYDGTTLRIYLNGIEVGSAVASVGGLAASSGEFELSSDSESMRGYLDDVRVWNHAHSPNLIKLDRFVEIQNQAGLVAYWKLNEGSGTTAHSFIGSAHGTLMNMSDANWVSSDVQAPTHNPGNAMVFNSPVSAGQYLELQQRNELPIYNNGTSNAYTVSMWVKGEAQTSKAIYAEGLTGSNQPCFKIMTTSSGKVQIYILHSGGLVLNRSSTSTAFDNTWHHIAWVDNNGTATLYIDGVADASNFNYTRVAVSLDNSTIGAAHGQYASNHFVGQIDELNLWKVALSENQVKKYLHGAGYGSYNNLVSMFQFNESDGDVAYDVQNGNNGIWHSSNMSNASRVASEAPIGPSFGGTVYSRTWSGSPIYVYDDITIPDGNTLTINPGVTVHFDGYYQVAVQGRVLAMGTEQDSIRFTAEESDPWHGFRLIDTPASNDSTKFVYSSFTNASGGTTSPEYNGSALYVRNFHKVLVQNSSFRNNSNPCPLLSGAGGAANFSNSNAAIRHSEFINNSSGNVGGAISSHNSSLTIENCQFIGNSSANSGGAIYMTHGNSVVTNSMFKGNSSQMDGGAIHAGTAGSSISANIINCIFDDNIADNNGGGIALSAPQNTSKVINCTVVSNQATNGGGLFLSGTAYKTIQNTIVWGNSASNGNQVRISGTTQANFYHCDIQAGLSGFSYAVSASLSGDYTGCFELDPQLSYSASNPGSGWIVDPFSPCLNAGDPATVLSGASLYDINGNPRFYNNPYYPGNLNTALSRIDVGAIEDQTGNPIIPDGTVLEQSYTIHEPLYLYPERTLTINAGLTIAFAPDAWAYIMGNLMANGTAGNVITFTESIPGSRWKGIKFAADQSIPDAHSILDYCVIEKAHTGAGTNWGGNIHLWYYDDLLLRNCLIREGLAEVGGALYSRGSNVKMINSVMSDNVCTARGTGFYSNDSSVEIINCTIADNYKTGSQANPSYLAALYFNNVAVQPKIRNCIIWGNGSSPLYLEGGSYTNLKYCNIEGGYAGDGNIDVDPSFSGNASYPYSLEPYSYCINAGIADTTGLNLPTGDIGGDSRIYEHSQSLYNRVDMGAYEYQGLLAPGPFSASDGNNDYPGYVRLEWDFNPEYNIPINGFKIYRNGAHYETLSDTYNSYSDYNVIPGTIYTYTIQSYYSAESGDSYPDEGYIKPNGIISGNIKTSNNNPVMGVKVSINPSVGHCLHLNAGSSSSVNIPNPDAEMNSNFTLELWVNTSSVDVTLFNSDTHSLTINGDGIVQYTDGANTLTQQDSSVSVCDADWHHIAIVNDFTNNQVQMYLDDIIAASSAEYIFGNYNPAGFSIPAGITGYVDDLRLWEAARDSSQVVDAMHIVVPYDSPGLKGYWAMNEGTGTSVYDATNNSVNGSATNCTWSSAEPGIALGAITDAWGDYVITQIPYGSATTFAVTPAKTGHVFQPEQRLITLSNSNIAADNVNFTDNSMIPISGHIKFQDTAVPVEGAVIHLNGAPALPRVESNAEGYYVLEVEHGTACIVSVEYNNHPFNRTWNLGTVTYPRSNIDFENVFRTEVQVDVVGGQDSYPIGDFDVSLNSVDGLYTKEVTGQNWASGSIMVSNIPPLEYNVTVNPGTNDPFALVIDDQFQSLKTQYLDIRNPGETLDTLRYEWRAPLQIEVAWPDTMNLKHFVEYPDNEFYVVNQNEWVQIRFQAIEDYSYADHPNQVTYLSECDIEIVDEVGPARTFLGNFGGDTEFEYNFAPYLPNINSGYERQYQKMIEVTIFDGQSGRTVSCPQWCLTQGVKPTESTYATVSPQVPFLILHDPPGDNSFSSFGESDSYSWTLSTKVCKDDAHNQFDTIHAGHEFKTEVGTMFFSVGTQWEYIFDLSYDMNISASQSDSQEQTYTLSTNTEYRTSDSSDIIGDGADLFIGGAVNLIWGVTKILAWDDDTQSANLDSDIMVTPNGFDTMYLYTASQIENTVIPNNLAIGDTTSANLWQSYLDQNQSNKENAIENPNHTANVSFNAGAGYTYEEENTLEESNTIEFETTVSHEFGVEIGFIVDGTGAQGGYKFRTQMVMGNSETDTNTQTTTTSFTLADDDEASDLTFNADYFSLDVKKDPVYGTPVFNLLSGASSCPWEPNTQPRNGVMMTANSYTASNIPDDQPAVFLLYLTNTSQTNEPRRYYLETLHATNTTGATVQVNGVTLSSRMAFDLEGGETVTAVMTVEPGIIGYELEGLTLEFYADGDRGYDGPEGHYFNVYKSFNIYWEAPYSRVTIAAPQDNWIVNQVSNNQLDILLRNYDLSKPDFSSILIQYKALSGATWFPAMEIPRDSLELHPSYYTASWDVSSLSDGRYQIRAVTTDEIQANWYSESLSGVIDRYGPEVVGLPQPSDGILHLGDIIALHFSEDIDPNSILPDSVVMGVVGEALIIDCTVASYSNYITVVPNVENYWLENKTLSVSVSGITDLYGNSMEDELTWEFYVNANPVYWQTSKIEIIKALGQSYTFTAKLINSGGQLSSFNLTDLPGWLTANPMSGTLMPLDDQTISFSITSQLGFGAFQETLYADIPGLGREPLILAVSVLADPPQWTSELSFNYDHTMSIIGQIVIEEVVSEDQNDIIGAFIMNDSGEYECRGVTNIQYVDLLEGSYQFFLTIHSNVEYGEEIVLRIWDASSCKDYFSVEEEYVFLSGANYGTPITPEAIHPTGQLIQERPLSNGWSWISTNLLNSSSMIVDSVLTSLSPANNDLIKSQTQYAQYTSGSGWLGTLSEISTLGMYKIKLAASDHLVLTGALEDPDYSDVDYGSGWNWISYIPHVSISVGEALGNVTNLSSGDVIKSQHAFAQYISGTGWIGSLLFMNPGEGYMLKTAESGSFTYPDYQIPRGFRHLRDPEPLPEIPGWELNPLAFEYSANITSVLHHEGQISDQEIVLGAFVDDECRGIAEAIEVWGQPMYFLTVYANTSGEDLSFKAYFPTSGTEVEIPATLSFVNNQVLGNPNQPYILQLPSLGLDVPKNLRLTLQDGQISLIWDEVPGADSYKIYCSTDPDIPFEDWNVLAQNVITPPWTDPTIAGKKFYRIVACKEIERESAVPPASPPVSKSRFQNKEH